MTAVRDIVFLVIVGGLVWWLRRAGVTPSKVRELVRLLTDQAPGARVKTESTRVPFRPVPTQNVAPPTPATAAAPPATAARGRRQVARRATPFVRGHVTHNTAAPCWRCGRPRRECAGH